MGTPYLSACDIWSPFFVRAGTGQGIESRLQGYCHRYGLWPQQKTATKTSEENTHVLRGLSSFNRATYVTTTHYNAETLQWSYINSAHRALYWRRLSCFWPGWCSRYYFFFFLCIYIPSSTFYFNTIYFLSSLSFSLAKENYYTRSPSRFPLALHPNYGGTPVQFIQWTFRLFFFACWRPFNCLPYPTLCHELSAVVVDYCCDFCIEYSRYSRVRSTWDRNLITNSTGSVQGLTPRVDHRDARPDDVKQVVSNTVCSTGEDVFTFHLL